MRRSYFSTIKKSKLPTKPRVGSTPKLDSNGLLLSEPLDEWWINSKKNHYCFWTLLHNKSNNLGGMEPLNKTQISSLLAISSTEVTNLINKAIANLEDLLEVEGLNKLLMEVFLK